MKIMAVDYGDARTGLAVCDRTEFLASPIGIIEEKSLAKVAEKIVYASREYEVGMIVIGLPKNMDGSEGPRAQKSHKLADTLRAIVPIPVELWDERQTTVSAANILSENGTYGKKRKDVLDAVAATVILARRRRQRRSKMSYRVSTQVYSGPFDLLLQLVTRQKVDIGAISISEVAEQYLAEAERIEALDLDVASDFLLVAATLLDIKAASLVPQEAPRKVDDDDDEFDEDLEELSALDGDALREVLIQRLIAYKQFKGAAAALGARMQAESRMRPRVAGPDPEFLGLMPDYLAGITLRGLAVICADLDGKRQTFLLEAEHVAPHRVPLDLTVASVDRFTMAHQTCTFRELLDGDATTEQLVVTFLAMLELAKRGSLTLSQDEIFGTICINRIEGAEAYVPGEGPELTE